MPAIGPLAPEVRLAATPWGRMPCLQVMLSNSQFPFQNRGRGAPPDGNGQLLGLGANDHGVGPAAPLASHLRLSPQSDAKCNADPDDRIFGWDVGNSRDCRFGAGQELTMYNQSAITVSRRNAQGIAFLIAGIAVFAVQDLILKLLSSAYPLHQAMVLRSLTAFPLLIGLVMVNGGLATLVTPGLRRMIGRAFVMFVAYTSYYLALAALPLATTVALYFGAPLFITLLSVLVLKEHVGLLRWLAVALGFAGVVIMVRPGSDVFDWAALLAVLSGLTYGASMVSARRLGGTETAPALAFWGNAVFLFCGLVLSAIFGTGEYAGTGHQSIAFMTRGWVFPSGFDLFLMMTCGVIAAVGLTLLTQAYRIAQSNVVAPFEYTALIWGVLYGWMFWGDWPDAVGWIGITVIVGAGLFVIWREWAEASRPMPVSA